MGQRYFPCQLDPARPGRAELLPREAHHAFVVLRLKPGDEILVTDGEGGRFRARLLDRAAGQGVVEILERLADSHPAVALTLLTALPKGKRATVLVEKCAELGATRIVPVLFRHSVRRPEKEALVERLRRVAEAACKQAEWATRVEIAAAQRFAAVEWSQVTPGELRLLAEARGDCPTLAALLREHRPRSVTVIIGPEGGLTDEEAASARQAGFLPTSLSAGVLRVETAAIAACAAVAQYAQETLR